MSDHRSEDLRKALDAKRALRTAAAAAEASAKAQAVAAATAPEVFIRECDRFVRSPTQL